MEILGYIFVGYVLLKVLLWIIDRFTTKTVTIEDLSADVCEWFLMHHPLPTKKLPPKIILSDEKSDYDGNFTFHNNTITLYIKNLTTYSQVVEIVNHEMVHWYLITSKSKDQLYEKQLLEYGYDNHPQEIWCRTLGTKLTEIYIEEHS